MTPARFLIVNADDFGLSPGVNRGIALAHERGVVTSASLMVLRPPARDAAGYARDHPALGLGLHLELGEWAFRDGRWWLTSQVVSLDDAVAVAAEVDRQVDRFFRLTGRPPSHIDSHQHAHRAATIRPAATAAAGALGVPLRLFDPRVRYLGDFYGQSPEGYPCPDAIRAGRLADLVAALPGGWTELACHPGLGRDTGSAYDAERETEAETLCDTSVRSRLAELGVALRTFHDLPPRRPDGPPGAGPGGGRSG